MLISVDNLKTSLKTVAASSFGHDIAAAGDQEENKTTLFFEGPDRKNMRLSLLKDDSFDESLIILQAYATTDPEFATYDREANKLKSILNIKSIDTFNGIKYLHCVGPDEETFKNIVTLWTNAIKTAHDSVPKSQYPQPS